MKFTYLASDAKNKTHKGVVEAVDLKEATKLLISQGWYIKKITLRGRFKVKYGRRCFRPKGISLIDKALLVKHLGAMLRSGIGLDEALEAVAEQASSKRFKSVVSKVLAGIKTGQSLGNALAKFPDVFDPLIIKIIKAGEENGALAENLNRLAEELEDQIEFRRHVKAIAFYPLVVLAAAFGLGLILIYFVLPEITFLLKTLHPELFVSTEILFWLAGAADKHSLLVLAGIAVGLIFIGFLLKQKIVKSFWQPLLVRLPIIGNIVTNYNLVLINRTLGLLLKSGVAIDQAIAVAAETADNLVYQKRLKNILPQVQRGKRFSDALAVLKQSKKHPLFPLVVIKMIGIGERSGQFDEPLAHLFEYSQKEIDKATENLITILEPILLIIIGLIIGLIAVFVVIPIYQTTGELGH